MKTGRFEANKLCPEKVYHKKYVKFSITNKTVKLKIKNKPLFRENVVAINIFNTVVILKDASVMKSDIF